MVAQQTFTTPFTLAECTNDAYGPFYEFLPLGLEVMIVRAVRTFTSRVGAPLQVEGPYEKAKTRWNTFRFLFAITYRTI
jgi:hypothetical protein